MTKSYSGSYVSEMAFVTALFKSLTDPTVDNHLFVGPDGLEYELKDIRLHEDGEVTIEIEES